MRIRLDAMGVVDFDAGQRRDRRRAGRFAARAEVRAHGGDGAARGLAPGAQLRAGGRRLQPALRAAARTSRRSSAWRSRWRSGNNPRLRCEAYFAITSNTVQFGARAAALRRARTGSASTAMSASTCWCSCNPFALDRRLPRLGAAQARLAQSVQGRGRRRRCEGPRPLRVSGKASVRDLLVRLHDALRQDAHRRRAAAAAAGRRRARRAAPRASPTPRAGARRAPAEPGATASRCASSRRATALVLDPLGDLVVSQQVRAARTPLATSNIFGGAPVAGARRFTLHGEPRRRSRRRTTVPGRRSRRRSSSYMSDDEKLAEPVVRGHGAASCSARPRRASTRREIVDAVPRLPDDRHRRPRGGTPAPLPDPYRPGPGAPARVAAGRRRCRRPPPHHRRRRASATPPRRRPPACARRAGSPSRSRTRPCARQQQPRPDVEPGRRPARPPAGTGAPASGRSCPCLTGRLRPPHELSVAFLPWVRQGAATAVDRGGHSGADQPARGRRSRRPSRSTARCRSA